MAGSGKDSGKNKVKQINHVESSVCPFSSMKYPSSRPSRDPSATGSRSCPQLLSEGKWPHTHPCSGGLGRTAGAGTGGQVKETPPGPGATAHTWLRGYCFQSVGTMGSVADEPEAGAEGEARLVLNETCLIARAGQRPCMDMAPSLE